MKKLRFWLIALLCLVTALGCLSATSRAADTDDIYNGCTVKFGSYPQTRVKDSATITKLNGVAKSWQKYPYYSKNVGNDTFPTKLDKSMMRYCDFSYGGVKYRAVIIDKYRPGDVRNIPDNLSDARQQTNGYVKGTVYYFIWEPIEWIVLDKDEGIVQSRKVLDAQPFNAYFENTGSRYMSAQDTESSASAWHYSTLRQWLNGDDDYYTSYGNFNFYYSAFNASERGAVRAQMRSYSVELKPYLGYDSVFLPTEAEFIQYRSLITSAANTDYAESQGKSKPGSSGGNYWYTIKAANDKKEYYCVDQSMSYSDDSYSNITSTITGIRPMLNLDLSSDAVIGPFSISVLSVFYRLPHLYWGEQSDAESFDVYRCPGDGDPDSASSWTKLTALEGSETGYADNSAVTERSYYYYVRKNTSSGYEDSRYVKGYAKLATPTLTVTNNALSGKPVLSWTATDKADGYLVYRKVLSSSGTSSWSKLTDSPLTVRNYTDTTAAAGVRYGYWVRAYSSLGEDFNSVYKFTDGSTICCRLGTPQPTVTTLSNGKPRLDWARVAGDSGSGNVIYTVHYRPKNVSGWTDAAVTSSPGFTHTGASDYYTCHYYVTAHMNGLDAVFDSAPSATLYWNRRPQIVTNPQSVSGYVGEHVPFSVTAVGVGIYYQWQYSTNGGETWKNFSGNSNYPSISVEALASKNGYRYRCIVQNETGASATSSAAKLTVLSKITAQPSDTSVCVNDTASFQIGAAGPGVKYQWQYKYPDESWKNSGYASARTATLSFAAQAKYNGLKYRCVITDANGNTLTSSTVTLTILSKITQQPKSTQAVTGAAVKFTVKATGAGLKYQWQYKYPDESWKNSGYASAKTAALSFAALAKYNGLKYRCKITDANGTVRTTSAVTLTILPEITQQPKSKTAAAGTTVKFTVQATGAGLKYQWQYKYPNESWKNSGFSSAKTATLSFAAQAKYNGLQYRCLITDENGKTLTTTAVTLTVN